MKTLIVLIAIGSLLTGCAKKKEYKEVYKESTFSKSLLSSDPSDPYVYVPSVENTPMNVTASRPYWVGDQKLVVFKFREKSLEVLEVPSDPRFAQNENNFSPVFKLDIDHKDFRCAKDEYGECSNKEEEVDDAAWDSKKFFKADFSKLTVLETNSLPEQLSNLFLQCFSDEGSEVKSVDLTEDAVNIRVERTLSAKIYCADVESFEDLRNLTFKVNYHYSFVKLSKLASKNYRPVVYPFEDQNTFGFFTTTMKKLSADNRTTLDSEITYMNRWNPEAREIVYQLNDAFYEKGMESIRRATERGVETINNSFNQAGVRLKIKLADGRGKAIGDLRNNFLVLVKDPQASGVIGYGPTIANPLSGEILKGQVVMYYGTIRKFIQETYEELVAEKKEALSRASTEAAVVAAEVVEGGELKNGLVQELHRGQELLAVSQKELLSLFTKNAPIEHNTATIPGLGDLVVPGRKLLNRLQGEIFSHERILKHHSLEDKIEEMSRNNMYHESMVNWQGALAEAVSIGAIDLASAKPWNELSEPEKEKIIEALMPFVWIPTLVHEIGHNLGLRHNFNGSEDKENYYTTAEARALGIERDVTYSSVMDYSYSSLNQLPVMGKYDIAALAFGYNREVELKDGRKVKLPKATLEEMKKDGSLELVKEFRFCTDEHVSVNPGCNRFDEGSSLEEIAKHYVKAYRKNYEKRNKRNNRLRFSSVSDAEHYFSLRYTFQGLRLFFEVFDRIKGQYPGLPAEQWDSIAFLKDLKAAAKVAADFYVEILKTPSVHCALVNKASGQLAGIVPIEDISTSASNCFDEENLGLNRERYAVIAQTGKHLNHSRGSELPGGIKADPSELSVRGIWMDKLLAMEFLTKRETGISTFDDYRTSFLDHPEFRTEVMEALLGLMTDKVKLKVEMETATGERIPMEHTFEIGSTHNIKRSFSRAINQRLGITRASTDIREILFPMVKTNFLTADDEITNLALLKQFSAFRLEPTIYINPDEFAVMVDIKDGRGGPAARFAASSAMTLAKSLIEQRNVRAKLEKFERKKLIEIIIARQQGKVPEKVEEELKFPYEVEEEKLEAFLLGQLPSDEVLQKILTIMSR